jgi:hypothetical protein
LVVGPLISPFLTVDTGDTVNTDHFNPPFVTPINGISPTKGDKCVHELASYQEAISNLLKGDTGGF